MKDLQAPNAYIRIKFYGESGIKIKVQGVKETMLNFFFSFSLKKTFLK